MPTITLSNVVLLADSSGFTASGTFTDQGADQYQILSDVRLSEENSGQIAQLDAGADGQIQVTSPAHHLQNDDWVSITGLPPEAAAANGAWKIARLSADLFTLLGTNASGFQPFLPVQKYRWSLTRVPWSSAPPIQVNNPNWKFDYMPVRKSLIYEARAVMNYVSNNSAFAIYSASQTIVVP